MASQLYKITICEVSDEAMASRTGKAASLVDTLGVEADGIDRAKVAAKKVLRDKGYELRSVNFTSEREMVAYVLPRKTRA
jgi:hypothetical protein